MSSRATVAVAAAGLALALWSACSPPPETADVLPGHSRPVLQHDWPHPAELRFDDSGFTPADPDSALVVTPAGVRAYVIPDPADPLVEVTAAVPLGRHFETEDVAGAAEAAAGALRRALAERLGDGLVATTRIAQEGGLTRLSVEILAEDWRPALAALVGALRDPGAAPSAVTSGASGAGASGGGAGAGPGGGRGRALAELTRLVAVYPIAPPAPGAGIGPTAAGDLLAGALRPESVVLGIAGGAGREEAEALLAEVTGGWTAAGAPPEGHPPTLAAGRTPTETLHTVDVPGFMSWIALGHAMEAIAPEDEAAVAVLEEVVNIRLNIATREIRGLTNRALLLLPAATDGAGLLYLRTSGRSESVAPLIRYSMEELARIRRPDGAPTPEELEQARGGLALGWWQDSLDGARRTAATYALETVRRGSLERLLAWPARVRAVTAERVTAAAGRYLRPDAMTAVVVGQIDEVREARHPRWPTALEDVPGLLRPGGPER